MPVQDYDQAVDALRKLPEDKQRLVLGKLTPEARKGILSHLSGPQNFTDNPKGEGLYRMSQSPASEQGEQDIYYSQVKPEIQVPFGHVQDALNAGYRLHFDEKPRFQKDQAHQNEGPTLLERANTKIQSMLSPSGGKVGNLPVGIAPMTVDQVKAAGRVLYSTPAYLGSVLMAAKKMATGEDQGDELLGLLDPSKVPEQLYNQFREDWKKDKQTAVNNLIGTIEGMGIVTGATHGATEAVKGAPSMEGVKNVGERVRRGLQEKFGGGHDFVEKKVENFRNENENARIGAKAKDEVTEAKRGAVEAINQERQTAHGERVQEHGEKIQQQAEKHAEKIAKWEKKKAKILKEHQDATKQVQEENTKAQQDHFAEVEKVARDKQSAQGIDNQRQILQKTIQDRSNELQQRINNAEKNAKAADDAAWDAWRKKLGNAQANMSPVVDKINAQAKDMTPEQVSEFRDIMKQSNPMGGSATQVRDDSSIQAFGSKYDLLTDQQKAVIDQDLAQRGINVNTAQANDVPVSRLHGWKTELERAVRTAKDGNVRHAIGKVLDSVRQLENDVSAQYGADAELKAARALHGPYVEAFVNSPNEPPTAASTFLKQVTPEFAKSERLASLGKQLGEYDPEIPKIAQQLDSEQEQLGKLPSEAEVRKLMAQEVPPPPTPKALPVQPEIDPEPKPPALPKPPKEPSKKPYAQPEKDRPTVPAAKDFTPERRAELEKNIKKFGATGQWAWRLILGTTGEMAMGMLHGGATEAVGRFGGGLIVGQGIIRLFSNVMRRDSVLDWMAKPSPEDLKLIETLPPADAERMRTAIKGLATEEVKNDPAKSKTVVSPIIGAWLAGRSVGQGSKSIDDVKKEGEERQKGAQIKDTVGPQSSAKPVSPEDVKAQAEQLQSQFYKGGFSREQGPQNSSAAPHTHVFSIEAWKRANPTGNVDAAKIQAQHMGYEVVA